MKHFTFKQVGSCIVDSKVLAYKIKTPTTTNVGEFITIGNGAKHRVVYIKTDDNSHDNAVSLLQNFDDFYDVDGYNKMIQYCQKINGFIVTYICID
jgi:hypothetical protein